LSYSLRRWLSLRYRIEQYRLSPMLAKRSDPRTQNHIARFGDNAVELDALDPRILQQIVEEAIARRFDEEIYEGVKAQEREAQEELRECT